MDREWREGGAPGGGASTPAPGHTPGKHTLTEGIARSATGETIAADAGAKVDTAQGSPGAPLPTDTRARFESSLGADLSGVRVHAGAASAAAADSISARAYTTGSDIHFADGQYDPSSAGGEHLLAHEVAHTVQQAGGGGGPQRKGNVSSPGDPAEVDADRAADAMTTGAAYTVSAASSGVALHRDYRTEMAGFESARAVANKTMATADWLNVGRHLTAFSIEDIEDIIMKKMSLGERAYTLAASMSAPGQIDRVDQLIRQHDGEAVRIADIYHAWDVAIAAHDWPRCANLLHGMSDGDASRRLKPLTWFDKMDIQKAAPDDERLAKMIEASEADRVHLVQLAYDSAVAKGDWQAAANQLHGMDDEGIRTRMHALAFVNLTAIKAVASARIIKFCDEEIAARPKAETNPDGKTPVQVTDPVPIVPALVDLPDFSGDARTTADAAGAGPWGGSAIATKFMTDLTAAYGAREADNQIAKAKEPKPDRATLAASIAAKRLTVLGDEWSKAINTYKLYKEGIHPENTPTLKFAVFAKYFCSDVREDYLFKLDKTLGFGRAFVDTMTPGALEDTAMQDIISPGSGTQVKPICNNFIRLFPQSPPVTFYNYAGHGVGELKGKGYCLDIFLRGDRDPQTGFMPKEQALQVINNIAATAAAVGGDWRICYNDASVATAARAKWGARFGYSGGEAGGSNWHGPLNLHIHLDLVPSTKPETGIPIDATSVPQPNEHH
jgi:hypothetical protein